MIKNKILYILMALFLLSSCYPAAKPKKEPNWRYAPQMYDSVPYNHDNYNEIFLNNVTSQKYPHNTIQYDQEIDLIEFSDFTQMSKYYLNNPIDNSLFNINEGKKLYIAICSHCHGKCGKSDSDMILSERYPIKPPKFNDCNNIRPRNNISIKEYNPGMIYHSIKYGYGIMGAHRNILSTKEIWQIVLHVQKLQNI
ncbi:MAG: cytochrome c [Bacteroides sp.]|nr:MAG: cytochrome c [Bacteroides sp.]